MPEYTDRSGVIPTNHGPVRGFHGNGMRKWLGIPYASPPLGELRWRPPAEPHPWTEPLAAIDFGGICAQEEGSFPGFGHNSTSEDCLYLNVYAPLSTQCEARLPVMVWLHGGGLFQGASSDYDPSALVKQGKVVFVSFNYRVNLFGFFSHPSVNGEDHACGNYGIMDQQAALRWVQRNIGAFGGDSNNVTIFGESAGAISVSAHIASSASAGLFHKAIVQSGGSPISFPHPSVESFEESGVALATAAGCEDQTADALRALSAAQLIKVNSVPKGEFGTTRFPFGLMEEGVIIPRNMRQRFLDGDFNKAPLMIGVTKDEFAWFQSMIELATGLTVSEEAYPAVLEHSITAASKSGFLGVQIPPFESILQRYPLSDFVHPARAVAAAVGDAGIIATSGRRSARVIKKFVPTVFAYEFDVEDAPASWPSVSFPHGSAHAQELQFLFPGFHGASGAVNPLTAAQEELSSKMVSYWTSFARTGSPNGDDGPSDLPYWSVYEPEEDNIMLLQAPQPQAVSNWGSRHHMDFWDSFYR
ncbi:carboxylesterase family protein [Purpureocillium lavendulum]|uniref:Carboxylic ester hydrolase n=1 Tax=Purpureocillium lavendulum TaxID=1247861 RepID=A0AB34FTD3_9HYPO|nr:carboxylesterase family protein [Purpureocillium lavendulum]